MYQSTLMTVHASRDISLVFYIKDHHLYPIQDDHLKQIATKANQGGADNLWKYMTDMKWSKKSSNYIMYQQLIDNGDAHMLGKAMPELKMYNSEISS